MIRHALALALNFKFIYLLVVTFIILNAANIYVNFITILSKKTSLFKKKNTLWTF